nr:YjcZ family sporulation protein [Streptococcus oralis]
MSEKCEHRHDDCNRRNHGCGGGFALLIVLFILL